MRFEKTEPGKGKASRRILAVPREETMNGNPEKLAEKEYKRMIEYKDLIHHSRSFSGIYEGIPNDTILLQESPDLTLSFFLCQPIVGMGRIKESKLEEIKAFLRDPNKDDKKKHFIDFLDPETYEVEGPFEFDTYVINWESGGVIPGLEVTVIKGEGIEKVEEARKKWEEIYNKWGWDVYDINKKMKTEPNEKVGRKVTRPSELIRVAKEVARYEVTTPPFADFQKKNGTYFF